MVNMKPSGVQWIGDIPSEWKLGKVKNRFYFTKTIVGNEVDDYERLALTLGGVIKRSKEANDGLQPEKFDGYQILKKNELVFKLIDLANVATSRVGLSPYTGIVSPAYIVLHHRKNGCPRYAEYYFLSMWMNEVFNHLGGDGVRSSLNAKDLLNVPFPLISETEQLAIADYLDDRCSKLDEIIIEAEKSIEEYKELKQAVIFEAVTKGVKNKTSNNKSLDWCDTGICDDWNTSQIRYLYRLRNERNEAPLEEVNLISLYTDKGVVQHADLEKTTGNKAVTADGYKLVYPEDIVVNIILCWMGAMGRCEYQGVTSPAYDIYEPIDSKRVCSRYYHYLFRTERFAGKCYTLGRGIMMMRWRTYSSEFRSIRVPVPPLSEQIAIADYLDKRIGDMDSLISEKQSLIEDLKAYKKSLIYEFVTGKRRIL